MILKYLSADAADFLRLSQRKITYHDCALEGNGRARGRSSLLFPSDRNIKNKNSLDT